MLTIYGVYRSRAARIYWMALELRIPFTSVPVIQARRLADPYGADAALSTVSPAFLAINPNGQIPAIDDDGLILSESLAITLYLAARHGGALSGETVAETGEITMWTLKAATEIEPQAVRIILSHDAGDDTTEAGRMSIAAAIRALKTPLSALEAHLATRPYLVGGRFTVADLNLAEVMRYAAAAPATLAPYPHITAWLARCQNRPAFRTMMATREAEAV